MNCLTQSNLNLIIQKSISIFIVLAIIFSCDLVPQAEATPRRVSKTRTSKKVVRSRRSVKRSHKKTARRRHTTRRHKRVVARRGYRNSGYRRSGTRRSTTVRHTPYYPRRRATSSSTGFINNTILEVGGHLFSPIKGKVNTGMHFGIGSRLGPVAGVIEAQLTQGQSGAELRDLNAQLRIYLPISSNVELFPMASIGHSYHGSQDGSSHLDLGIGAQLKLTSNLAIGGRYGARVIAEENNGLPTNGHDLLAQVSVKF
jgi:hypothetical protein